MASAVQTDDEALFDHNDEKVKAFRATLRSTDDANKLQACVAMRDELLEQQTELEWLFVSIEEVMLQECPQYKEKKGRLSHSTDEEAKQWARFFDQWCPTSPSAMHVLCIR
ncbi:hypothetical protein PMIN03_012876 [Paraphaeosphaeria minitans]